MSSLFRLINLGLMCTLFLLIMVEVKSPSGTSKVCSICAKGNPGLRARNLKWYGDETEELCGRLYTPANECDSVVRVRIYTCCKCGTTTWVSNGLCKGQHNGTLPPDRVFEQSQPVGSSVGSN
ncbi:hypothetical protein PGTUg99_017527 [Puccinia graminis f. sp. tritici]|uniref:Secreted protein n=1 Tax=Puccinia graminis f. sp. tritici TaxID=56615 RepID=A0A5B0PID0_PUCGR|nr:hypothetical protein PGTUg99_017527 [Puccinia graminis f. sp. tritici]